MSRMERRGEKGCVDADLQVQHGGSRVEGQCCERVLLNSGEGMDGSRGAWWVGGRVPNCTALHCPTLPSPESE